MKSIVKYLRQPSMVPPKRISRILALLVVVLLWAGPMMAGSALEGILPQQEKEIQHRPVAVGAMPTELGSPMEMTLSDESKPPYKAEQVQTAATVEEVLVTQLATQAKSKSLNAPRPHTQMERNNGRISAWFALFACVCFLLGVVFFYPLILSFIFGVLAIVFGAMGIKKGKEGRDWALMGLVLGIVCTGLAVFVVGIIIYWLSQFSLDFSFG